MAIEVKAHITGTVWKIECKVGDAVREGDVLLILESMKMEIPIEAPEDGTVTEIKTQEGAPVADGTVVAVLS
ncbi:MAG TPA: biotin/lipoyl-binding carrier protein [Myxococcota bacterium]|jgi:acetyl-CoA carboxylase biotin carboxyl carrier protein|nr:biotin/lipoyl-binding carrier protein [Myxococcota bacterium]